MHKTLRGQSLPGRARAQLNYGLEEVTHHQETIPPKAKAAKAHIVHWSNADILGSEKPSWNASTVDRDCRFPDPAVKRVLSTGYSIRPDIDPRAEVVLKRDPIVAGETSKFVFDATGTMRQRSSNLGKSTKFKVPVHPDLVDALKWNHSTQPVKKDLEQAHRTATETCLRSTRRRTKTLAGTAPSLVERERQFVRTLREEKTRRLGTTAALVAPKNPEQTVLDFDKLAEEAKQQEESAPNGVIYSLDWKKKEYEHLGEWMYSDIEGCEAWSCCMNTRFDGPGCSVQKPRVHKGWNLSSF